MATDQGLLAKIKKLEQKITEKERDISSRLSRITEAVAALDDLSRQIPELNNQNRDNNDIYKLFKLRLEMFSNEKGPLDNLYKENSQLRNQLLLLSSSLYGRNSSEEKHEDYSVPSATYYEIWPRSTKDIRDESPDEYDAFACVCSWKTFMPLEALRLLRDLEPQEHHILQVEQRMRIELNSNISFQEISCGSLEMLVNSNLRDVFEIALNVTKGSSDCDETITLHKYETLAKSYLGKRLCLQNSVCFRVANDGIEHDFIVFGAGAQSMESSIRCCYPKLINVCGTACLSLLNAGLALEDCVMPGLAIAGGCIQLCAVYLLPRSFPVLVAMSPILPWGDSIHERREIARWVLHGILFAKSLAEKIVKIPLISLPMTKVKAPSLNLADYFFKNVKGLRESKQDIWSISTLHTEVNYTMEIYDVLFRASPTAEEFILFPRGVISVPGDYSQPFLRDSLIERCRIDKLYVGEKGGVPLLVFSRLKHSEGWEDARRKPTLKYRASFLAKLRTAMELLDLAGVSHVDLLPANVMWRPLKRTAEGKVEIEGSADGDMGSDEVEIRLIDFELAILFGYQIPDEIVSACGYDSDKRYPFRREDEGTVQCAQSRQNWFFFHAIRLWFDCDDKESFSDFMRENSEHVFMTIKTT